MTLCQDVHTADITTKRPSYVVMFVLFCRYVTGVNYVGLALIEYTTETAEISKTRGRILRSPNLRLVTAG